MNQMIKSDAIERVLITGDLERLTPDQRISYYNTVCNSLGLNPFTQPFAYIKLNGKLQLYAKREAADQLRKINGISLTIVSQDVKDDLLTVTVRATDKTGRTDEDCGVVAFPAALRGDARANAALKAVTKAKRRVTLSISGLGWLDETEVETIPEARRQLQQRETPPHDPETGEVLEDGIPGFLDRRQESAASSETTAADEPAPSPSPDEEIGAGESMRDQFITSCREIIRRHTDVKELGDWWHSAEQKKARRNFELNKDEVKSLTDFVIARRDALNANRGTGK